MDPGRAGTCPRDQGPQQRFLLKIPSQAHSNPPTSSLPALGGQDSVWSRNHVYYDGVRMVEVRNGKSSSLTYMSGAGGGLS